MWSLSRRPASILPGLLAVSALAILLGSGSCLAEATLAPSGPRTRNLSSAPRSLGDLIEGAVIYDGGRVVMEGEVVGDIMRRGEIVWINIYDGTATIGVWGPAELLREVSLPGDYKTRGDRVRVEGIFRRADPRQGGELDIQASSLEVVARGAQATPPVKPAQVHWALISTGLAALLGALWLRSRTVPDTVGNA